MGHLRLSDEQLAVQATLPEAQCLPVTESCVIIYPGEGHDDWWDLKQLMDAMVHTIDFTEKLASGSWSAHQHTKDSPQMHRM